MSAPQFQLQWNPAEDITTYELALCLKVLIANTNKYASAARVQAAYEGLPATAKRHFLPSQGRAAA